MDGMTDVSRVFGKINHEDRDAIKVMLADAVNFMEHAGMGTNQIGVGFKIGLTAFALQAAGLDHRDKSLSAPLNVAIDNCINETIAQLRTRQPESGNG